MSMCLIYLKLYQSLFVSHDLLYLFNRKASSQCGKMKETDKGGAG